MARRGEHSNPQASRIDHFPIAQVTAHTPQETAPDRSHRGAGGRDDLVDAIGVIAVAMADQHQRDPAQRCQPIDVVILIRSGIDEDNFVAVRSAKHPGVGALQRHRARVFTEQNRSRLSDRPQYAVRGRGRGHFTSTMSSTSTGASNGNSATPTAERACAPASPNTSPKNSEAPLTTPG